MYSPQDKINQIVKIEEALIIVDQCVENSGVTVKDARLIIEAWEILKAELKKSENGRKAVSKLPQASVH